MRGILASDVQGQENWCIGCAGRREGRACPDKIKLLGLSALPTNHEPSSPATSWMCDAPLSIEAPPPEHLPARNSRPQLEIHTHTLQPVLCPSRSSLLAPRPSRQPRRATSQTSILAQQPSLPRHAHAHTHVPPVAYKYRASPCERVAPLLFTPTPIPAWYRARQWPARTLPLLWAPPSWRL